MKFLLRRIEYAPSHHNPNAPIFFLTEQVESDTMQKDIVLGGFCMYTTAKKLSVLCVILGAIHAFMGLALMVFASSMGLTFFEMFALIFYIVTSAGIFIILTCALRSLCADLEYDEEINAQHYVDLKKQVEELEYRVKR